MILHELPVGSKVREPVTGRVFLVAAQEHPGYEGTILWSDRIVRKGCFDAAEPDQTDYKVSKYGNGDYAGSNVHQWLNSAERDWFSPLHPLDAPPSGGNISISENAYDTEAGYLYPYPPAFRDALVENRIPCVSREGGVCKKSFVRAKVFLLSADELGLRRFTRVQEGSLMPLFYDFRMRLGFKEADPSDFNFPGEVTETNREMGWYYWLRTPHHKYPFLAAHVHWSGYISYHQAWNSHIGILPACAMRSDVEVTDQPDEDQVYELKLGGAAQ